MEEITSDHPDSSPSSPNNPSSPSSETLHMGLASPALVMELKKPHTLKPVHTHTGLTTVFCGRGRINAASSQSQSPSPSASTNQHAAKSQSLSNEKPN